MADVSEVQVTRCADALWDIAREISALRQQFTLLQEFIMSTVPSGLASLQAFVTSFQAFAAQQATDLAALTTSIDAAITAIQSSGSSEDTQVQAAVTSLQSALQTVSANETALEALNTSLSGAENPNPTQIPVANTAKLPMKASTK